MPFALRPDPSAPPPNAPKGPPLHGDKPALKLLPPNPDGEEVELGKAPFIGPDEGPASIEALNGFATPVI